MSYPNTVIRQSINGVNLFIVGEHHNNEHSEDLCDLVLQNEQPSVVAVESCPERFDFYGGSGYQSSGGLLAAEQYVRETDAELYLLDIIQSEASLEVQLLPESTEHLEKEQPEFDESTIQEDGGITSIEIMDEFLEEQKDYSEKRFDFIWNTREEYMKNTLLQKLQTVPEGETVVVILGLSHIYKFTELLEDADTNDVSVDSEFVHERSFELDYLDLVEERESD